MNRTSAVLAIVTTLAACVACSGAPAPRTCDPAFAAWAKAGFSGAVAISTHGRFDCLAGFGTADDVTGAPLGAGTVFAIGSITKAVTAASVLGLADEGRLSLDDRAGSLLPELRGPSAGVTIRQLMLHTGGLRGSHGDDDEPLGRDEAVKAIGRLELAFEPGKGYAYSNAGYTLLALIVDRMSGPGYRGYTAATTLRLPGGAVAGGFWNGEPAARGQRATGYPAEGGPGRRGGFAGPHWALDGNGGLAMSTRDLAAWTRALFTGQVVSAASTRVIAAAGHELDNGRSETPGWVSYDRSVFGTPVLATAGGGDEIGHNAVVAWLPERDQVIAIQSNRSRVTAEALLRKLLPALARGGPLPLPKVAAGTVDPAIVGIYRLDTGGSYSVTVTDGRLAISATGADAVAALMPPRGVPAADLRDHERRVLAMLGGRTAVGAEERAALETRHGAITGVEPAGTVVSDGEPRTYVTVTAVGRSLLAWYAVDDEGGVSAATIMAEPPALAFVPSGRGLYHPDDPTEAGPEVSVRFTGRGLTVTGPPGDVVAGRVR